MKAMVADDSREMRMCIAASLAEFGFDVHEAASGRAALAALRAEGPFALCLVGWKLPDIQGTELVRLIRLWMAPQGRPRILMITSQGCRSGVLEAFTAGSDEYLERPFSPAMLIGKLAMLRLLPGCAPLPA